MGELAQRVMAGDRAGARDVLRRWVDWFGPGNVWVELHDNLVQGDQPRIRAQVSLARELGAGVVATGDVHYHDPERHRLHDALCAIRHRTTLDGCHTQRRPNREFYLRSPAEQAERFAEWPEAVASTLRIAERCAFDLTEDLGYRLPRRTSPRPTPPIRGWPSSAGGSSTSATAGRRSASARRLDEELGSSPGTGWPASSSCTTRCWSWPRRWPARCGATPSGGAWHAARPGPRLEVSSIICYLIGLSHIDPIEKNLFLGRFLNEDDVEPARHRPGLPRDIRDQLFLEVYERTGHDHAALVATFPPYRIRSAVRDLGKVLGLPAAEIDRLAKLAEGYGSATNVRVEMERVPELGPLAATRAGSTSSSWPAAGRLPPPPLPARRRMVIASDPLIDCVPVQPAARPGRYICHWDKDDIDDARMIKIDFLALGMLSLVEECLDLCAIHRGTDIDLSRIDFEDQRVYDRIGRGDTVGVFQIESRAQAGILPRTQPRNLDDLTVQVAIIRPRPHRRRGGPQLRRGPLQPRFAQPRPARLRPGGAG